MAWNSTQTSSAVSHTHHRTDLTVDTANNTLLTTEGLFIAVRKQAHTATESIYLQFHIEGYYN